MSPLGSITLEYNDTLRNYQTQITAIVIGMLLHIATTILFESGDGHKFNLNKILAIIVAIAIAFFI